MKSLHIAVALLLLLFVQFEQIFSMACGRPLSNHNSLGGDNTALVRHWPWLAAVYYKNDEATVPVYQCGGTVITPKSVLTAAHCVARFNDTLEKAKVSVSLGRLNLGDDENWAQSIQIAEISLHPSYNVSVDWENDIAVIKLAANATFNNFVRPICLWKASKNNLSTISRDGMVTVWGRTAISSDLTQLAFVPVVTSRTCLPSNRNVSRSTSFCAGFQIGTNTLDGGNGGSMTFKENGRYYIRGIVSATLGLESNDTGHYSTHYAIYTDIEQYLPWIEEVAIDCEKMIRCNRGFSLLNQYVLCEVQLYIKISERKCKIIFLDSSNVHVTGLSVYGELEALPDLSDAVKKFENLKILQFPAKRIQILERLNFAVFRKLETLILNGNVITEIGADTFDDLRYLKLLDLSSNRLKETHRDLFKELQDLESLYLDGNQLEFVPEDLFRMNTKLERINLGNNKIKSMHRDVFKELGRLNDLSLTGNQLEILPEGLFRNNKQLQVVLLQDNKITTIETDFQDLLSLGILDLRNNVCIEESCDVWSFCGTNSRNEMQQKLMDTCPIRRTNSFSSTFLCFVLINGAVFGMILYDILT